MIVRRLLALAALLALGACSSDDGTWMPNPVSVDALRQAATKAGTSPKNCPLKLDVPGALRSAGVDQAAKFDEADASVSKSEKPAADPIAAERKGMSGIDAVAGVYIECDYRIDEKTLDVYLVATPRKGAVNLLAPVIARDAHMKLSDLTKFIVPPPGPGEIKVGGGSVAISGLPADGGDAAMMVSSTATKVHGDTLRSVASKLIGTVAF